VLAAVAVASAGNRTFAGWFVLGAFLLGYRGEHLWPRS